MKYSCGHRLELVAGKASGMETALSSPTLHTTLSSIMSGVSLRD